MNLGQLIIKHEIIIDIDNIHMVNEAKQLFEQDLLSSDDIKIYMKKIKNENAIPEQMTLFKKKTCEQLSLPL